MPRIDIRLTAPHFNLVIDTFNNIINNSNDEIAQLRRAGNQEAADALAKDVEVIERFRILLEKKAR